MERSPLPLPTRSTSSGFARAGTSLLLVEQYVNRALAAADQVCVLTKGRVVFDGRPADVAEEVFEHYLGIDPAAATPTGAPLI